MFKRLADNMSLWFSLRNIDRQATLSFIEEAKEANKEPELKEMSWFTTSNNIIDEFYDFTVVNYGDSEIRTKETEEDKEEELPDLTPEEFSVHVNHIIDAKKKWAEKQGVVVLEEFLKALDNTTNDQEKKEVFNRFR